jgi:hypothetical protein
MKSLLVEEDILSRQTGIVAEKRHNVWFDCRIVLKVLQLFPEACFLELPIESLLVEKEVLSRETWIIAEKGNNFWSDSWIALKYLK